MTELNGAVMSGVSQSVEAQVDEIISKYNRGFEPEDAADAHDANDAEIFIRTALRIAILGAQCKPSVKHSRKRFSDASKKRRSSAKRTVK